MRPQNWMSSIFSAMWFARSTSEFQNVTSRSQCKERVKLSCRNSVHVKDDTLGHPTDCKWSHFCVLAIPGFLDHQSYGSSNWEVGAKWLILWDLGNKVIFGYCLRLFKANKNWSYYTGVMWKSWNDQCEFREMHIFQYCSQNVLNLVNFMEICMCTLTWQYASQKRRDWPKCSNALVFEWPDKLVPMCVFCAVLSQRFSVLWHDWSQTEVGNYEEWERGRKGAREDRHWRQRKAKRRETRCKTCFE